MRTTVRAVAAAVCASLAAPVPLFAAGEGIHAGPMLLFPEAGVTLSHDDNIGLASSDSESDWMTTLSASLRLEMPVGRFSLAGEGGLDTVRYADNDAEDCTNWRVGASVGAEFPGGLSFLAGGSHSDRYLTGTQEYGPGEDSSVNTLHGKVAYGVRDALRFELGAGKTDYAYDASHERERSETLLRAALHWRWRPRLSASAETTLTGYEYESNTAQDGSATQFAVGLQWDVSGRSSGSAKAGYQWKRYDREDGTRGIEDGSYYTVSVGAKHSLTRRTTVHLDLVRASHESDFAMNPYFLSTAVGASLSHRLTARVYGRASVRRRWDDYPNPTDYASPYAPAAGIHSGTRSDAVLDGSLTLGYDVNRWLALEVAYAGERRTSSFEVFEYSARRLSLGARAAF